MILPTKPLHEITRQAIHVLSREIGVADTLRFLNQFHGGLRSYTDERNALFGEMTLDEILGEIRSGPASGTES